MKELVQSKLKQILVYGLVLLVLVCQTPESFGDAATPTTGNPNGVNAIPAEAQAEDVSKPDHIIGTGTPESCTAEAFVQAVAQGGTIVFNGGTEPFTITLSEPAKVFNNADPDVVIDGGGLVTLSGGGTTRILYMNTCDPKQVWTTDHADNQDHPRLTIQNLTFANGNSIGEKEYDGGGAVFVRGGRFKVVNCSFVNNVCAGTGPDVGGGALRVFDQYNDQPVYVVNSTFGGAPGLGNVGSNGGAISSIGVSWTIINSLFSYNEAIGNGGNPAESGTPGGGSGGAIYNDGNKMTLKILGTRIENNKVKAYGAGIFFVTNDHSGDIILDNVLLANNTGGSWYPAVEGISMHSDTKLTITNSTNYGTAAAKATKLLVNNQKVSISAYNINGNNYFKLRDIAQLLSDTNKKFNVSWNDDSKTILVTSGVDYIPVGGELVLRGQQNPQNYSQGKPDILLDGNQIEWSAYLINNNNYFKLRDIAETLDFEVSWDEDSKAILVDSNF